MIRVSICTNILEELWRLKQMVQSIMAGLSKNIVLYCFRSGEDLLFEIDATGNMDIILLDAEMSGMNGIETAQILRRKDTKVVLIFTSSHDRYCKEMIGVQPFAFLDKPIDEEELKRILCHALQTRCYVSEGYRFSYRKRQYNIPLDKIRYFQSDKRIVWVNTLHSSPLMKEYSFYGKLEEVQKTVNKMSVRFLRVRKSFLVNTRFITEYTSDRVVLDDGMVIEISKNYKNSVRQHYSMFLKDI